MKRAPSMKRLRAAFPSLTDENLREVRRAIHFDDIDAVDRALDNHGVECIRNANSDVVAEYSNSGETYAPSIFLDRETGNYRLTTLGDYVETYERRHSQLP